MASAADIKTMLDHLARVVDESHTGRSDPAGSVNGTDEMATIALVSVVARDSAVKTVAKHCSMALSMVSLCAGRASSNWSVFSALSPAQPAFGLSKGQSQLTLTVVA
jgi:hypothetical protein